MYCKESPRFTFKSLIFFWPSVTSLFGTRTGTTLALYPLNSIVAFSGSLGLLNCLFGVTDFAFKLVLKANHCALDTGTLLFPFVVIPKEKEIRPLARPTPEPKYAFL